MSEKLKELLHRMEAWPKEAQEEAVASLHAIEEEIAEPYELTNEDRVAIDHGLEDVRQGNVASEEDVEKLFSHYRRA
ncbi:MAG: hypothetical protein Q7S26_00825 [bacterium]|nr:hypothetical protein [bacterium]